MSNTVRNHKDNVFCLLYREKKNLLSLYNAMNGTSYENEEELEVVTLEEAICMKIRNDAAFVIDSRLNLYEQQGFSDIVTAVAYDLLSECDSGRIFSGICAGAGSLLQAADLSVPDGERDCSGNSSSDRI